MHTHSRIPPSTSFPPAAPASTEKVGEKGKDVVPASYTPTVPSSPEANLLDPSTGTAIKWDEKPMDLGDKQAGPGKAGVGVGVNIVVPVSPDKRLVPYRESPTPDPLRPWYEPALESTPKKPSP